MLEVIDVILNGLLVLIVASIIFTIVIVYINSRGYPYTSVWGWEPCDKGTSLDSLTFFMIGQLECKCCILFRGIFIGLYFAGVFLIIFNL